MRIPGSRTLLTITPKALLRTLVGARFYAGIIDDAERDMLNTGATLILRPGLILGHNTSDGKWYICWGSQLSAAEAAGQTTLSVTTGHGNTRFTTSDPDSNAFNVKIVGPGGTPAEQDLGALTGVAASTITVTTALNVAYPSGSYVYRSPATDNDQDIAIGILYQYTSVDNSLGGDIEASAQILVAGTIDESELIGATDLQIGQLRDPNLGDIAHQFMFES